MQTLKKLKKRESGTVNLRKINTKKIYKELETKSEGKRLGVLDCLGVSKVATK